ncbi:MAG: hypothetical protein JNK70_00490 [Phycisphaerae bacterium]|nr:hypothetical protein [Phycisphaerae bacterium]
MIKQFVWASTAVLGLCAAASVGHARPEPWVSPPDGRPEPMEVIEAPDLTGDGIPDRIELHPNRVQYGDRLGSAAIISGKHNLPIGYYGPARGEAAGLRAWLIDDRNGDGKPDIAFECYFLTADGDLAAYDTIVWTSPWQRDPASRARTPSRILRQAGDLNADGVVDGLDLALWGELSAAEDPLADVTIDGRIDAEDLLAIAARADAGREITPDESYDRTRLDTAHRWMIEYRRTHVATARSASCDRFWVDKSNRDYQEIRAFLPGPTQHVDVRLELPDVCSCDKPEHDGPAQWMVYKAGLGIGHCWDFWDDPHMSGWTLLEEGERHAVLRLSGPPGLWLVYYTKYFPWPPHNPVWSWYAVYAFTIAVWMNDVDIGYQYRPASDEPEYNDIPAAYLPNMGSFGEVEEDFIDQHPEDARVVLVADRDGDGDGVPQYADSVGLFTDAAGIDTAMRPAVTPIHVSIAGEVLASDLRWPLTRLTYPQSKPSEITTTESELLSPPPGVRLWSANSLTQRSQDAINPITGYGWLLEPGVYANPVFINYNQHCIALPDDPTPGSAKVAQAYWLEAVTPSQIPGDIEIKLEVDPSGTGEEWMCSDSVRVTAVKAELWGQGWKEQEWRRVSGLVLSRLPDLVEDPDDEYSIGRFESLTSGPWMMHKYRIYDPRENIDPIAWVGPNPVQMLRYGSYWETDPFLIPEEVAGKKVHPDALLIPPTIVNGKIQVSYNPEWWEPTAGKMTVKVSRYEQELADAVKDVVEKLEMDGWTPPIATDDGAFGKAVHIEIAKKIKGEQWLHNHWIELNTGKIISIGEATPPIYTSQQICQVDIMRAKKGYVPQIGEVLDVNKIENLYDIKTSKNGAIPKTQRNRLLQIIKSEQKLKMAASVRRWTNAAGWNDAAALRKRLKMLAMVGLATSAIAFVTNASEPDRFRQDIEPTILELQRETDPNMKRVISAELIQKISSHFNQYYPFSDAVDVFEVVLVYRELGKGD